MTNSLKQNIGAGVIIQAHLTQGIIDITDANQNGLRMSFSLLEPLQNAITKILNHNQRRLGFILPEDMGGL